MNKMESLRKKQSIIVTVLMLSTGLQIGSFYVVVAQRTGRIWAKIKNSRAGPAKRAKFIIALIKYADLYRPLGRRHHHCVSSLLADVIRQIA